MRKKKARAKKAGRGIKGQVVHVTIRAARSACDVAPPHPRISKKADGRLSWHAANTDAKIYFPTGLPFGWVEMPVQQGTTVDSGQIVPGCLPGEYFYTVFCYRCGATGRFAEVGSDPSVKVDP